MDASGLHNRLSNQANARMLIGLWDIRAALLGPPVNHAWTAGDTQRIAYLPAGLSCERQTEAAHWFQALDFRCSAQADDAQLVLLLMRPSVQSLIAVNKA